VQSVAFTRDGKLLATGSEDHTIRLWNVQSRQLVRELKGEGPVYCLAFSPDGQTLASGSCKMYEGSPDKGARLWDVGTGELVRKLELPAYVRALTFSPDGNWLAVGAPEWRDIHVWNARNYDEPPKLLMGPGGYSALAFSPDSQWLASGSYEPMVRLWDLLTTEEIAALEFKTGTVHALAFSPDGSEVLIGTNTLNLLRWNLPTRTLAATIRGGEVFAARYLADGSQFLTSTGDSIDLWSAADNKRIALLAGHVDEVRALDLAPTEPLIASGAQDGLVKLWPIPQRSELEQSRGTFWVGFSKEGRSLYRLGRTSLEVWDPARGVKTDTLASELKEPSAVNISRDATLLAVAQKQGPTIVWDLTGGSKRELAQDPETTAVAISPDGKLLAAGYSKSPALSEIKIWDLTTGQPLFVLPNKWQVGELSFSHDGTRLVVACWYEYANIHCDVVVWDVPKRERVADLVGHQMSVTSVEFSPDGQYIASCSWDNNVRLWDAKTCQHIATLEGHEASIYCLKFAPNSPRLFSGDGKGIVLIWDLLSHQQVGRLENHTALVRSLAISPNEELLISAASGNADDSGEVLLWPAPKKLHE
jgi:WD40 repeat protein